MSSSGTFPREHLAVTYLEPQNESTPFRQLRIWLLHLIPLTPPSGRSYWATCVFLTSCSLLLLLLGHCVLPASTTIPDPLLVTRTLHPADILFPECSLSQDVPPPGAPRCASTSSSLHTDRFSVPVCHPPLGLGSIGGWQNKGLRISVPSFSSFMIRPDRRPGHSGVK